VPTVVHVQRDPQGNVIRTEELEVTFLDAPELLHQPTGLHALHISRDAHGNEIARVELNVYITRKEPTE